MNHEDRRLSRMTHRFFGIGVFFKGLDGFLEILGAVLLSLLSPGQVSRAVALLTRHELSEDPHDFIANHVLAAVRNFPVDAKVFTVFYLLLHGLLKILLVWALLRSKLWAYPAAIGIFAVFGAYQTYRYSLSHSPIMAALTALDVLVIVLIGLEYRNLRKGTGAGGPL